MRKEFSKTIEKLGAENSDMLFLTGDLGFMALENVKAAMKNRFINAGVSEQNMVSMAAALASQGLRPVCYSIAPFIAFRPAEQIRLDVCLHNMNVKLVGNGGGYGYGIMGSTHHALEDIAVLSSFQNMRCYIPFCNEDVETVVMKMMKTTGPGYLRLGFGAKPEKLELPSYSPVRKLQKGSSATIVGMGPVLLNAFSALETLKDSKINADVFAVSEMPLIELTPELKESVSRTKKLIVLEEHVRTGGLGESLSALLLEHNVSCRLKHLYAKGYPNGLFGSQAYHQQLNGLDAGSIVNAVRESVNE